jgi:high-affinity iron transporter
LKMKERVFGRAPPAQTPLFSYQLRKSYNKLFLRRCSMLAGLVLSAREGLEAALVIGIVLGSLRKLHRPELAPVVWAGALSAAALSLALAILLTSLGARLEGKAEAIFEGFTMLLAAGVLTWMVFWMHRQSRHIKGDLEAGVRRAMLQTGKRGVFFIAFVSVLREGIELGLFLTAVALASGNMQTLAGALLGLCVAALLGWSMFTATARLNLRRFFLITSVFLILFAAGLVARGVHEFNEVGWIPPVVEHIWNTGAFVTDNSVAGQLATALLGYNSSPSLTEIFAYLGFLGAVAIGLRWNSTREPPAEEVRSQGS